MSDKTIKKWNAKAAERLAVGIAIYICLIPWAIYTSNISSLVPPGIQITHILYTA